METRRYSRSWGSTLTALFLFSAILFGGPAKSQNGAAPAVKGKRPNIIFIYTDDQRYDAIGMIQKAQGMKARFPWLKTPNIDRIGKEGVWFKNAFVVNSLCSPSRAAMLTSRYNHFNGVTNNHSELSDTSTSYGTVLSSNGYVTAFVGKWHMGRQKSRPGFTYSFSFIGQGHYFDCPMQLNEKEMVQTKGWVDEVSTDSAMAFIQRYKDVPFELSLAFKSSHYPWQAPEKYVHAFDTVHWQVPANEDYMSPYEKEYAGGKKVPSWTLTHDTIMIKYFSVLLAVDEQVGRLLNLLDSLHLTENTMVVYSSDNGYFLGEHNSSDKRAAYEESIRVPLLVRYPAKLPKGKTVEKIVLNVDLPATFVQAAGIPLPANFQGKNWIPMAQGKPVPWRKSFFYEYYYETPYIIPTLIAERTETAKLIRYPTRDDWSELFDLTRDGEERHNLINDPRAAALKAKMIKQFKQDSVAVGFMIPSYADKPPVDKEGHYVLPKKPEPKLITKPAG